MLFRFFIRIEKSEKIVIGILAKANLFVDQEKNCAMNSLKLVLSTPILIFFVALYNPLALSAQNCRNISGLTDSTTRTHIYVKWASHPTAQAFQVSYWDGNKVSHQQVNMNRARITRTANAPFELIAVQAVCPGGILSGFEYEMKGGIVITIDNIYRMKRDCGLPQVNYGVVLFYDLCMYTDWNSLCVAMNSVPPISKGFPMEAWIDELTSVLATAPSLLYEPWDDIGDCMQPSMRLAASSPQNLIAPNPFSDAVNIQLANHQTQANIRLLNAKGQLVRERRDIHSNHVKMETGHLPRGIYVLQIRQGDQLQTMRLVKM